MVQRGWLNLCRAALRGLKNFMSCGRTSGDTLPDAYDLRRIVALVFFPLRVESNILVISWSHGSVQESDPPHYARDQRERSREKNHFIHRRSSWEDPPVLLIGLPFTRQTISLQCEFGLFTMVKELLVVQGNLHRFVFSVLDRKWMKWLGYIR